MKKYSFYERKINYYETDKMAIVHHSNYARFLEESRIDMLAFYGIPLELFEELGYMVPVLEINSRFIESVRYGETIKIVPGLVKMTPVKFYIEYKIYDESMSKVVHEASSVHCFINNDYKPVSMKKLQPELYDKMLSIAKLYEKEDKGTYNDN